MRHIPVLLGEVLTSLQLSSGMNVVDGTVGDAGHAEAMLDATSPTGKLLALDADPESLLRAKQYLHRFGERVQFVRENFYRLSEVVQQTAFGPVHGILLDLGWSSPQFEERGRGFSFQNPNEPLDMRYTPGSGKPASEIVNEFSEEALEKIFREYGEERLSREIAKAIVSGRKDHSIETVGDLVNIILDTYRHKLKSKAPVPWVGGLHPATKIFQALRMVVNDELGVVEQVLPQAIQTLSPGGRLAVITFHSLEDRIVKHYFKSQEDKTIRIITKKPIVASDGEAEKNPRARSAKLRVVERIHV